MITYLDYLSWHHYAVLDNYYFLFTEAELESVGKSISKDTGLTHPCP